MAPNIGKKIEDYASKHLRELKQQEAKTGKKFTKYDIAIFMIQNGQLNKTEFASWMNTREGFDAQTMSKQQEQALKRGSVFGFAGYGGGEESYLDSLIPFSEKSDLEKFNIMNSPTKGLKFGATKEERAKRDKEIKTEIKQQKVKQQILNPKKAAEEKKLIHHLDSLPEVKKEYDEIMAEIKAQDEAAMSHDERKKFIASKFLKAWDKGEMLEMMSALEEFNSYMCSYIDDKLGITDAKESIKEKVHLNEAVEAINKYVDDGNDETITFAEGAWEFMKGLGDAADSLIGAQGVEMAGVFGAAGKAIQASGKFAPVLGGLMKTYFGAEASKLLGESGAKMLGAEEKEDFREAGTDAAFGVMMAHGTVSGLGAKGTKANKANDAVKPKVSEAGASEVKSGMNYNQALQALKSSNSAKTAEDASGNKIIVAHRNVLNFGDYTYYKFNSEGKLVETGKIPAKAMKDSGLAFQKVGEGQANLSLDFGIVESLIRSIKTNLAGKKIISGTKDKTAEPTLKEQAKLLQKKIKNSKWETEASEIFKKELENCKTVEEVNYLTDACRKKGYDFSEEAERRISDIIWVEIKDCKTVEDLETFKNNYAQKGVEVPKWHYEWQLHRIMRDKLQTLKTTDEILDFKANCPVKLWDGNYQGKLNDTIREEIRECKTLDELNTLRNNYKQKGIEADEFYFTSAQNGIISKEIDNCTSFDDLVSLKSKYAQQEIEFPQKSYESKGDLLIREEIDHCTTVEELEAIKAKCTANGIKVPKYNYENKLNGILSNLMDKYSTIEELQKFRDDYAAKGVSIDKNTYTSKVFNIISPELKSCKTVEDVAALKAKHTAKNYDIPEKFYKNRIENIVSADFEACKTSDELDACRDNYTAKGITVEEYSYDKQMSEIFKVEIASCKTVEELQAFREKYIKKGVDVALYLDYDKNSPNKKYTYGNMHDHLYAKQMTEIISQEIKNCKTIEELNNFKNKCSQKGINIPDDLCTERLHGIVQNRLKSCKTIDEINACRDKYKGLGIQDNVFDYYIQKLSASGLSPIEIRIKSGNEAPSGRFEKFEYNPNDPKYGNLTKVGKDIQTRLEREMNVLSESQIADMASDISVRMNVPESQVLDVMSRLTQFGNMKSLRKLSSEMDKLGVSGFYKDSGISTNSSFNYFHQKGQISFKGASLNNKKQAFILDDSGLKYLEKLDKKSIGEFYNKVLGGEIVLVELDGTGLKIGENYYSYTMLDGGQSLSAMTEAVLTQVKSGQPVETVLRGDFRQRLNKVFQNCGAEDGFADKYVKNVSAKGEASPSGVAAQIKPNMPDAGYIEMVINTVAERAGGLTESEKPLAKSVIAKYFDYMAKVYSSDSIAEILKEKHEAIEQHVLQLGKTMNDVVYIYPSEGKSFDLICLQYAKTNGIDPQKIVRCNGWSEDFAELEGKVVVLLDDVVGSGASMIHGPFQYDDFLGNKTDVNVLFAPVNCAVSGRQRITGEISSNNRTGKDFLLYDLKQQSEYEKFQSTLKPEEKRILDKVIGNKGYCNGGLVTGFQYMIPDNNSTLGAYLNIANLNNPGSTNANKPAGLTDNSYNMDIHKILTDYLENMP